jgi:diguanylate cyclase (GGDEF)-like protein
MRYMTSLSVAIAVPILVYSLGRVTHDRKQLRLRADQLATQDALTGLLSRPQFQIQLNAAYHRVMNQREPVALVLVTIRNHQHILDALGAAVGEQCVLRGVVKLQRILRDIDPAGRTGVAQFGLLLEGVSSRQKVSERMVKLIGSGLIPLAGLKPEVTLHFQAACVLLHENPLAPDVVLQALEGLLEKMGTRTRRPIRFLEPQDTQAAELDSDQ